MGFKSRIFELLKPIIHWIVTFPRTYAYYFYNRKAALLDSDSAWHNFKQTYAWCDGLIIGSAPWLCYLCQKVRNWAKGAVRPYVEKEADLNDLGQLDNLVIHGHWTTKLVGAKHKIPLRIKPSWMWPTVKHIYPVSSYLYTQHHKQMMRTPMTPAMRMLQQQLLRSRLESDRLAVR